MKSTVCACVLLYLISTGNAQFGGFFGQSNMYGGWGFGIDPFTAALLFGFDYNELMALQALSGGSRGRGMRPGVQRQAMRDMEALAALGFIDGPDAPDARKAAGGRQGGAKPRAGGQRAARRRGGEGAPPPARKGKGRQKKQQGPRRRANRARNQ